jgi:hypothetical protein
MAAHPRRRFLVLYVGGFSRTAAVGCSRLLAGSLTCYGTGAPLFPFVRTCQDDSGHVVRVLQTPFMQVVVQRTFSHRPQLFLIQRPKVS